ncbi:hypothetical protein [Thioclava sp. DLFJ4-1]|uniref:hypothetical protein n=1 Tax=Thioclava sp. DLFJ4-1 TaxID=1915313 RepID=UPI0011805294|nr:hypothetical protein [Thioclava sp. DLFJ4-1]
MLHLLVTGNSGNAVTERSRPDAKAKIGLGGKARRILFVVRPDPGKSSNSICADRCFQGYVGRWSPSWLMLDQALDLLKFEADDILVRLQELGYGHLYPVRNETGAPNFDGYWEMKRIG